MKTQSVFCINPRDWEATERHFFDSPPFNFTVMDDFLTNQACQELRSSVVTQKGWGFLNVADSNRVLCIRNFSSNLIPQVTADLQAQLANLVGNLELVEYSAFMNRKNDGLGIYSDNERITLNLYLTPEEFNLEPATGGMTLFDVKCASEQSLLELNSPHKCTPYVQAKTTG